MENKIEVGTILKIDLGFLKGTFDIVYCGMPNEETFALSPFLRHYGEVGFSPNIYYSSKSKRIKLLEHKFDVIEVTREYIILGL